MDYCRAEVLHKHCNTIPSFVQTVQFHGIVNTKADALIKEISELYNTRTLDELINNSFLAAKHMQEVGLFDNCLSIIDTSANSHSYVVNFYVKEPKSFNIGMKMGMTINGDADANINSGRKNIFGRGESGELSYTKTIQNGHSFDFNAIKPFLGWQKYSNISVALSRSFDYLRWNKANSTQNSLIIQSNNHYRKSCLLHSLKILLSWRFFEPRVDAPFSVREHAGHTSKVSVENVIGFDTRDRALIPSRGIFTRLTTEYAGLVGDSAFLKNQIDVQAAARLFYGVFLCASLRSTMINGLSGRSIHLLDRVYLGGPHDIRGFEINSIGPRIESASMGGSFGCAAALHLYKSLMPVNVLFTHLFVTGGGISSVRSRNWLRDVWDNPR